MESMTDWAFSCPISAEVSCVRGDWGVLRTLVVLHHVPQVVTA